MANCARRCAARRARRWKVATGARRGGDSGTTRTNNYAPAANRLTSAFMKTRMFLLLTACAALVRADVTDDLLDQLKSEVKAEVKAAREKNDDSGQQRAYQMQEILLRLQRTATQVDNGEYSLAQTVESIGALSTSERVEEICKALARELHNAQEKSDKTLVEEVEKTLGGALRATL